MAKSAGKQSVPKKRAANSSKENKAAARKADRPRRTSKPSSGKSSAPKAPNFGGISDGAVRKATGNGWNGWIDLIDGAGGADLSHAQIAKHLAEACSVPPWWSQMVTVGYEQAKGRRVKHEKPEGFEIGVSKTLNASVEKAFAAWRNSGARKKWLVDHGFKIRKETPFKSMRIDWVDGRTRLSVNFYARPNGKSQVTAQHMKLKTSAEAEKMKAYWAKQLERLSAYFGS